MLCLIRMPLTEGFKEGKRENKEEDLYVQLLKNHRFREVSHYYATTFLLDVPLIHDDDDDDDSLKSSKLIIIGKT
jgi:hypothetical protein